MKPRARAQPAAPPIRFAGSAKTTQHFQGRLSTAPHSSRVSRRAGRAVRRSATRGPFLARRRGLLLSISDVPPRCASPALTGPSHLLARALGTKKLTQAHRSDTHIHTHYGVAFTESQGVRCVGATGSRAGRDITQAREGGPRCGQPRDGRVALNPSLRHWACAWREGPVCGCARRTRPPAGRARRAMTFGATRRVRAESRDHDTLAGGGRGREQVASVAVGGRWGGSNEAPPRGDTKCVRAGAVLV